MTPSPLPRLLYEVGVLYKLLVVATGMAIPRGVQAQLPQRNANYSYSSYVIMFWDFPEQSECLGGAITQCDSIGRCNACVQYGTVK